MTDDVGRSSAGSRQQRQRRAAAALAQQRRNDQRRRTVARVLAGVVAVVVVVGLGAAYQSSRAPQGGGPVPAAAVDGAFLVGRTGLPVTVEIYEDFLCPACRTFEAAAGPVLQQLADAGTATVAYHPIAFLDRASTTQYSTRSLNAAACAADDGVFPAMHAALFEAQPPEGGAGLSDDVLLELGRTAGVTDPGFDACVRDRRYAGWVVDVTDAASRAGVNGTPTVLVNGTPLTELSVAALERAVAAAG